MMVQIYEKNNVLKRTNLDTLAQLEKAPQTEASSGGKKTLLKRARSKYISNNVSLKLADQGSDLKKSYFNTFHCCNVLTQHGQEVTGKYCNNRWCLTCNRIRTAKLINGYYKTLTELNDKYFVTLTIPNVIGTDLRETTKDMIKTFRAIQKTFCKRKTSIIGIRKLEITFNSNRNDFHPHFHLIVSGHQIAVDVVSEWLKRYPNANLQAQDIRPSDDNAVMELFKYFTKIVTKGNIFISALDTIFLSMRGLRVFQPMGIKKNVSEDIEELRSEIYSDLENLETFWTWIDNDWIDKNTGETLTGYSPSENVTTLINSTK